MTSAIEPRIADKRLPPNGSRESLGRYLGSPIIFGALINNRRFLRQLILVLLLSMAGPAGGQMPYDHKPLPPRPAIELQPYIEATTPNPLPQRNDMSTPDDPHIEAVPGSPLQQPDNMSNLGSPSAELCQPRCENSVLPGFTRPCENWARRPFSVGWFAGMVQGSPLMDDWVGLNQGFIGGYRIGWDHEQCWGAEMRFVFSSVELYDSERAKQAQWDDDTRRGYSPSDPWRRRFDRRRDADIFQWDVDLIYYPYGDTPIRPYLMAGLGTTSITFMDRLSDTRHTAVFSLPVGVGVKYLWSDRLGLRLDLTDDIAFSGHTIETFQNLSLTAGVEVRLGGTQRAYWPWNPSRHYW